MFYSCIEGTHATEWMQWPNNLLWYGKPDGLSILWYWLLGLCMSFAIICFIYSIQMLSTWHIWPIAHECWTYPTCMSCLEHSRLFCHFNKYTLWNLGCHFNKLNGAWYCCFNKSVQWSISTRTALWQIERNITLTDFMGKVCFIFFVMIRCIVGSV